MDDPSDVALSPDERAKMIVDYVLDYVEKAGRFYGSGRSRGLELSVHVDLRTGQTRDLVDVMVEGAQQIMNGSALYRGKKS